MIKTSPHIGSQREPCVILSIIIIILLAGKSTSSKWNKTSALIPGFPEKFQPDNGCFPLLLNKYWEYKNCSTERRVESFDVL